MKICKVNNYTAPARDAQGTQRVIESMTKTLIEMGHEVTLLINPDSKTDIAQVVNRIPDDTDIVHYHGGLPQDYGHEEGKFRWITTSHGGGADPPDMVEKLKKYVDHIVFVSNFCSKVYNSNCVVHTSARPDDYIFKSKKENYFLWLAGTDWGEEKGLFSSISIAKDFGLKLKIAGGGKNQTIINMIKERTNDKIEYLGFVNGEEKLNLLTNAKALLMIGTIADACPLTSIEALASGTPVIARNIASHPEIIDKNTGILCEDAAEIRKAFFKVNKIDPQNCKKRFLENFTSEICTKKYINLYEYAIKNGSLKGWK